MSESAEEEQLQQEIEQLREDLGETVEALVHKVDVPARAAELKDDVIERGTELGERVVERGRQETQRALTAAERFRETLRQNPKIRWAAVAGTGITAVLVALVVRRGQRR